MRDKIQEMRNILNVVDVPSIGGNTLGNDRGNGDEVISEGSVDMRKADFSEYPPMYEVMRDALVAGGFKGKFDNGTWRFVVAINGKTVFVEMGGSENVYLKFPSFGLVTKGAPADRYVKNLKDFLKFMNNYSV